MTAPTAVSVVVPNLDGATLLERNLPPLMSELAGFPGSEIIVADAASTDGTTSRLADRFGASVRVLPSAERVGFAANCNRAVAHARREAVLCLNSDVTVEPGFLGPLLRALADPGVFAATPAILRRGSTPGRWFNESVHRAFHGFGLVYHSRLRDEELPRHGGPYPVAYACGAAVVFRRSVFESLHGFDTLYDPFYWEDFDLCYRAWKRGWATVYVPGSRVYHDHRATIGRFYTDEEVDTILERNRFLFSWRNITDRWLTAVHFVMLPVKLAEGVVGGRTAVTRGFRAARPLFPRAWSGRSVERCESRRSDRATLRMFAGQSRDLADRGRRERHS